MCVETKSTGAPLSYRWGLWRGDALRAEGERVWLGGYAQQLHGAAWSALVDRLAALPDSAGPADDYGSAYGDLKTYLVATAEPGRSTPEGGPLAIGDAFELGGVRLRLEHAVEVPGG